MAKLTDKQKRFCEEYILDFNGTAASIRAGYKPHSARQNSFQLLERPQVQEYIKQLKGELKERSMISAEAVVQELAKIGFHNVQDYISKGNTVRDLTKIPREHAASISAIKVIEHKRGRGKTALTHKVTSFKLHDKRAALESLGKHLGIFEKDNNQKKDKVIIKVTTKKSDGG